MAITMQVINNPSHLTLKLLATAVGISTSFSAHSADWEATSSISVKESYTSNLNLSSSNEASSFVTTISPRFSLKRNGSRVQSSIRYQLSAVEFSDEAGDDDIRHSLNAVVNSELIEDRFFVNTSATVSQSFLSSADRVAGDIDGIDANTTETYTFRLSPYWKQKLGDDASVLVKLNYTNVSFDSDTANDTEGVNVDINFDMSPSSSRFFWGIEVDQSQNSPAGNDSTTSRSVSAFIGYRHSAQLSTRYTYGYIDNDLDSTTDSRADDGDFWGISASWKPSPLSSLNASYDSRLQATSDYGLTFNRKLRNGSFIFDYSEGISDFQASFFNTSRLFQNTVTGEFTVVEDPNYIPSENEVLAALISDGSPSIVDDKFINKSTTANLVLSRGKSTYSASTFHRVREYQSGALDTETDTGLNLGWTHRLNRRMSSSMNLSWSDIELSDDTNDKLSSISFSLNRRLSRDTNASFDINFRNRDSEVSTREYDEFGVGLNFAHNF